MATKTKSKSAKKASNLGRLEGAGVLVSEHFTAGHKKKVEKLSDAEVAVLIKIRKKWGATPKAKHHLRPFFV